MRQDSSGDVMAVQSTWKWIGDEVRRGREQTYRVETTRAFFFGQSAYLKGDLDQCPRYTRCQDDAAQRVMQQSFEVSLSRTTHADSRSDIDLDGGILRQLVAALHLHGSVDSADDTVSAMRVCCGTICAVQVREDG